MKNLILEHKKLIEKNKILELSCNQARGYKRALRKRSKGVSAKKEKKTFFYNQPNKKNK